MDYQRLEQDLKTGTTTVGVITRDSVVLAADMRASMGNIAYDEESEKVYAITDYLAVTNAGNVGDSLTIIKFLRSQAKLFELEREEKMTPRAAASLLSNVLNASRYYPFIVQLLIGGLEPEPRIYEVTPFGGSIERTKYAVSGSGTDFALTTLDQNYYPSMTEEEGIKLAVRAVEAGKRRDIYSGGVSVAVIVINAAGARKLRKDEVKKFLIDSKQEMPQAQKKNNSKKNN